MEDFRTRRLSLHQVTARDVSPAELARIAAELGCAHVCLFTQAPFENAPFPVVADQDVGELRRLMDGSGISMLGATSFPLQPQTNVIAYAGGLAKTERLGGALANVRVLDDDVARATDNLSRLGELAGNHGIELTIEFMGLGVPHMLEQTLEMIRQAGHGKLSLDPLHVVRTGVPMADLLQLDRGLIGYVQLCDGPLTATREEYAQEGAYDRLPPGAGAFPLIDFLHATPPGSPLSLEVPQEPLLRRGVSARNRARLAVEGARRLLETASARAAGSP